MTELHTEGAADGPASELSAEGATAAALSGPGSEGAAGAAVSEASQDAVADASVVIIAYTMERFARTCAAVESVFKQTLLPREIVLCVEGDAEFADRFRSRWQSRETRLPAIRVEGQPTPPSEQASPSDTGAADARCNDRIAAERTRGVQLASSPIVVFLDDDAEAEPDWLQRLLVPFADPSVVAVGGAPLPVYGKPRPRWFPFEFDWVWGCAYAGLPTETAPVLRLIGANMAARREAVLAVGGFHSVSDDLDMNHRLLQLSPENQLIYEPRAIVRHHVHEDRLTWSYFWRRCFFANRDKVAIMRGLGGAANLKADRRFVSRTLSVGIARSMRELLGGDIGGLERALATIAGVAVSAVAYAIGVLDWKIAAWRGGASSPTL